MRILVAGLIGGIVMFFWGAMAHMALPIGDAGFRTPVQQDAALDALAASTSGAGAYMFPSIAPEAYADGAAVEALRERSLGRPFAFVVWQPGGNPGVQDMAANLAIQCANVIAAALVLAWLLSLGTWSFGRRVLVAGSAGLFAWLAVNVPYWNWYMFPTQFTLAALAEQVIGWSLAGVAIAWWLGRSERSRA